MYIRNLHDRNRTFGFRRALTALCASFLLQSVVITDASAQSLGDVPQNHWAASFIEIVAGTGISAGCGGGNYCPDDAVTRAQMAVFLERGMNGSGYVPPAATGTVFLDVGAADFAANFIEQLAADGITAGCGNGNYCPDTVVTRDQMAVFLLRAKHGSSYSPPAPSGVFADVDPGHWAAAWIEQLAAEGVTAGCGNGNYCPTTMVARDQMAVFLVRTFDLSLPSAYATLTLDGVANDTPLANASISATVFEAGSNGASSTVFTTTADALGIFSLELTAQNADDFVVLTAEGVNAQQGAKLISYAGSAEFIASQANGGSTKITVIDYGALEISHVSTAMAVLAEKAHGGPIFSANDLSQVESKIAGTSLFDMAAAMKTLVDNAGVVLPAGADNSLDLLRDPFEYSGFLADLQTNHAQEFEAAGLGIADSLEQAFAVLAVPGMSYFVTRNYEPLRAGSFALQLNADASGEVILSEGKSDATWSVDILGRVIVDLLNPPQVESWGYPSDANPIPPSGQVRALTFTDRLMVKRLGDGTGVDPTLVLERVVTRYPDNPELPDLVEEAIVAGNRVFATFRAEDAQPFTAAEIAGATLAAGYHHQGNNRPATSVPRFGVEFLTFNASVSGIAERTLRTFIWTIDGDGALVIRFANGDTSTITRYSQDNIVSQTVIIGNLADGTATIVGHELVEYDGVSEFSEAMLLNRRYRALHAINGDDLDEFDFLYLPGGEGCRISGYDGQQSFADIDWWSTGGNTMDSWLYHPFDPTVPLQRRAWELIAIEIGQFGDRYWVIENLEHDSSFDPAFPWMDPATTSGRINAYEFIQDLSGIADPCAGP